MDASVNSILVNSVAPVKGERVGGGSGFNDGDQMVDQRRIKGWLQYPVLGRLKGGNSGGKSKNRNQSSIG